jgi:hypothetical protein
MLVNTRHLPSVFDFAKHIPIPGFPLFSSCHPGLTNLPRHHARPSVVPSDSHPRRQLLCKSAKVFGGSNCFPLLCRSSSRPTSSCRHETVKYLSSNHHALALSTKQPPSRRIRISPRRGGRCRGCSAAAGFLIGPGPQCYSALRPACLHGDAHPVITAPVEDQLLGTSADHPRSEPTPREDAESCRRRD